MLSRDVTWGVLKVIYNRNKKNNTESSDDLISKFKLEKIAETKKDTEPFYPKKEIN